MITIPLAALYMLFAAEPIAAQEADQAAQDVPALEEEYIADIDPNRAALTRVERHLRALKTYKARFRQQNPGGSIAVGTLYLERPGRIRFDYGDETPFLIVADGDVLSFVDYEVGQVTRWPVNDTPLRLIIGRDTDLASVGAAILVNPPGMEGVIALRATDEKRPEVGTITVFFREDDSQATGLELISWVVEDAQGRVTVVELDDAERNLLLEDSLWTYKDPRGLSRRRSRR